MTAGDRVLHVNSECDDGWPALGTVQKVSPAGYVIVEWDRNVVGMDTYFSPRTASVTLAVVTGEDAVPYHDWEPKQGWDPPLPKPYTPADYVCGACAVEQTEANYLDRCRAVRS